MKKIIYFTIILYIFIDCSSRKHISFSKDSNIKSVIENSQLNIVYRGIKNHLTIYVPKSDSIKVSGIGVKKESENNYSITPTIGTTLKITITGFFKGKEVIEKREFRIFKIDKPFASIGNRTGEITLSNKELADSKIEYFIPQFVYKLGKVGKFRYKINDEESVVNYGDEFNKSAKEKIFKMKSGDYMVIDELNFNPELQSVDLKKVTELKVLID